MAAPLTDGARRVYSERMAAPVRVDVTPAEWRKLQAQARRERVHASQLLGRIAREYLDVCESARREARNGSRADA